MTDHEWRSLILSKIEKIEESQESLVQMIHNHIIDSVKKESKMSHNHSSLKTKVNYLWGAFVFLLTTVAATIINKKL